MLLGLRPQAAVIRQDSMLELSVTPGTTPTPAPAPAPGLGPTPLLSRSVSRDTGLDASGEVVLLRRQVELLKQEVTRMRLRGEGIDVRRRGNGETSDEVLEDQVGQVN